jgi:hypothetical protein
MAIQQWKSPGRPGLRRCVACARLIVPRTHLTSDECQPRIKIVWAESVVLTWPTDYGPRQDLMHNRRYASNVRIGADGARPGVWISPHTGNRNCRPLTCSAVDHGRARWSPTGRRC